MYTVNNFHEFEFKFQVNGNFEYQAQLFEGG